MNSGDAPHSGLVLSRGHGKSLTVNIPFKELQVDNVFSCGVFDSLIAEWLVDRLSKPLYYNQEDFHPFD